VALKDVAFPVSEDVQSAIKGTPMVQRMSHNSSRSVTSAKNDMSPGCHVDGVGETLVFSPRGSVAKAGRRRVGVAKIKCHKSKAITVLLPDTHG